MTDRKTRTAYIFAFTFVSAVDFIYLFLAIALVPYWQGLSGSEIQSWWAGPFVGFSYIMVPLHVLSIITSIYAYVINRTSTSYPRLWLLALVTLLICQGFNFGLHGAVYNPALQSLSLAPDVALETFDNWDFYHTIRTISVSISLVAFMLIGIRGKS